MQYPVPQFTDVEDRIIGPLTLKQFLILFGVGIIIFLGYSTTKSILVTIFLFVLFGVPGLALAFAKINGRPMYNAIGYFMKFFSSPKLLIFHKEIQDLSPTEKLNDAQLSEPKSVEAPQTASETQVHLKEVQALLSKTVSAESEMAEKVRQG